MKSTSTRLRVALAFALLAALTACCEMDVVTSSALKDKPAFGDALVYALPKGQILISAHRRLGTSDELTALKASAAKADADAVKARAAAKVAATASDDDEDDADASDENGADKANKPKKTKAQTTAEAAKLAEATLAEWNKKVKDLAAKTWEEQVSITALPTVADPEARYAAQLAHHANRDDDLKLGVKDGLLTSSGLTTTDQLPAIITNLVEAATLHGSSAYSLNTPFSLDGETPHPVNLPPPPACEGYEFAMVLDPTSEHDLSELTRTWPLNSAFALEGSIKGMQKTLKVDASFNAHATGAGDTTLAGSKEQGLHYRAQVPVNIVVKLADANLAAAAARTHCDMKTVPQAQTFSAMLPDRRTDYVVAMKATPFVTTKFNYTFAAGMPTEYDVNRPSEALAVASLPVTVAKAAVSVVTDVFKLRVDQNTQATALVKGQTDLATAQLNAQTQKYKDEQAQLKAQQDYDAAKKAKDDADKAAAASAGDGAH